MASLRRLLAVARKETREILRDPITLGIAIALPVLMMFLFAYAITLDVRAVRLAVLDEDGSPESREFAASFLQSGYFRLHRVVRSPGEVERLLDQGAVRVALVIPAGFARNLGQGLSAQVQTLLDGSFANTAIIALNYVDAITEAYARRVQERRLAVQAGGTREGASAIRLEPRVRYNPGLRSEHFVVPGLFAVILMAFPPLLTALAVVRERERGSVLQIYVSPVRPWEFLAGKLLPYAGIAFLEMLLLLVVGRLWFGAPVRGSLALLLGLSLVYVLCTVGIGLLISTVTRTQVVALLLSIVLTLMPAFLFSGFLFPIASMPAAFQWYAHLFPAPYFLEIARGISLKGVGLGRLWPEAAILLAYGAALLAAASLLFRKKIG
ncbi:MAG: ABC transporter permease [Candidatus Rokubacteria bacterium]|nr:ABC transporter permease [Candidatus Rokubacteria bacterium]